MFKLLLSILVISASMQTFASDRIYRGQGRVLFERNHVSCEIQNNIDLTGRVHKVVFDLLCRDPWNGRLYNRSELYRCGEDYENCDVAAYDFEIFTGPRYRFACEQLESASCRFTYSFPDEINEP
jgi:hypothetical protein